ncbi:ZPR1 zinc finger domain protein [Aphelenchoides fujianensis]|nr:ZPR1 zinc finger domain protein [Aphelenchoides fujianensis]
MTTDEEPQVVYKELNADEEGSVMKIESLCMNCHKNGITQLMCTRIPFYKQVIVMSFSCEECGYRNSELQSGEPVQEFGSEIVLSVKETSDLNRTVVKSEYASVHVPELELEIPPKSQPGEITTVEGILMRVKQGLLQNQERRREVDPESGKKVDDFLRKLEDCLELRMKWTIKLNDPSGNCFIQNPDPLHVDPRCICSHYYRDLAANKLLALADDEEPEWKPTDDDREWKSYEDCKNTILHFDSPCPNCGEKLQVLMKPTDIPYFQTVIVMSSTCDRCGYKSNEVKPGGAIQDHGCKMAIQVKEEIDLARDVLKSDTCYMSIPELEIEVGPGALSGRFTTVEGLLIATKEQLKEQSAFFFGDSAESDTRPKLDAIFAALDEVVALKRAATLVLDDPAGNSYIQSISDEGEDVRLTKDFYTRNFEQNDELGINDMRTENYQELEPLDEAAEEDAAAET